MDGLIRSIESARDIRFGLFSRIGELEAEAMINETKISDLAKELMRLQRHEMNSGTRRLRDQHAIEERRSGVEKKIEHIETQYQVALDTWSRFKSRIMNAHEELGLSVCVC
ncbi:hypothetical protein ACHAW5_008047 [Stephanodiscus triporus]|uniref:Uncharacterized protein n=1 Tax=Stephanodiscus triporus TaxID=2934178 RepID=A0ABD3QF11_9STRA